MPARYRRLASLGVRSLEARLVLNATAELNAIGQLLVMGTGAAETVELQVESDGKLRLRDGAGDVIQINGHPDGVIAATNSLDPAVITSGQILFDLGAGDDVLRLQLPGGIDVSVAPSGGNDLTVVSGAGSAVVSSGSLDIDSETIVLDSNVRVFDFAGGVNLVGDVSIGSDATTTQFNVADGGLKVDGRLSIAGQTKLVSTSTTAASSPIDLSGAVLTASADSSDLNIDAGSSELVIGESNDSGGSHVANLSIDGSSGVRFAGARVVIDGELRITDVDSNTEIDSSVETASIEITTGAELVIRGSLRATSGSINLSSATRLLLVDDATLQVVSGGIAMNGGGGVIDLGAGQLVSESTTNEISLRHSSMIVLGETIAPQTGMLIEDVDAAVSQAPQTRLILDQLVVRNATAVDVSNEGNLLRLVDLGMVRRLRAVQTTGDLDLVIDAVGPITVERFSTSSGDIRVRQRGPGQSLEIVSMQTDNGSVAIEAEGSIRVERIIVSGGDVSIQALGDDSDLTVTSILAFGDGDVRLEAGDDVVDGDTSDAHRIEADDLRVIAHNGNGTDGSFNGIRLSTRVNDLVAIVDGGNSGDIEIDEVDRITLASSDETVEGGVKDIVSTVNGQIILRAAQIVVIDTSVGDEGSDLKGDPEIIARGDNGRIELVAAQRLELGDDVQLHATKVTSEAFIGTTAATRPMSAQASISNADRAVVLESGSVVLGERIEIFTGFGQGTAKFFGPRPSVEIIPDLERLIIADNRVRDGNGDAVKTAFYDPTSITVNVLEQALVNDANGILTLEIGNPGELGLVVDIDWGAGEFERRFQQLYNLGAGDTVVFDVDAVGNPVAQQSIGDADARLQVTHLYRQDDILNSTFNGRTAATEPLNVRFSVQHHPSILVLGSTIVQRGVADFAPGSVLSTTDNPVTHASENPGLETGAAAFLIPSLSIPMAFIPTRDVIPEFEATELVVRVTSDAQLQANRFAPVDSATTSVTVREEYFQLRVRAADPGAEDLVAPQKLPADVLDGDKLDRLFENLPDGTYEIQYVLGDGNERSIIRVDVRDGSAKLSAGDLEEGVLRLKRLRDTHDTN